MELRRSRAHVRHGTPFLHFVKVAPMPGSAAPQSEYTIRDTLFGDAPMNKWPADSAVKGEPWESLIRARSAAQAGRTTEAVALWTKIANTPGLESRHTLQAWNFLRTAGVSAPSTRAKELLGVVIEVPMEQGLDLLAAYPERTARYYNYSGAGVVWERPNDSLDAPIENLLKSASRILQAIGPWDKVRPPAPRAGNLRINILSPAGLHFGEGPFGALATDPLAKPTVDAAIALMQQLVALDTRA
jgi:hypothetical protein